MNRSVQLAIVAIVVTALVATGVLVVLASPAAADRETLYQLGSLDDLVQGKYGGIGTVGQMLEHGDIGLGTFEGLDGEMIVIDGRCYKAMTDGTVALVPNGAVPFAQVSRFDADGTVRLNGTMNMSAAEALIRSSLPSASIFYLLRIDGTFDALTVRSVPRQSTPYPPLADVIANQTVFPYQNVTGTMVGIWSPSDASGLSSAGFHFHFISDDRTKGGHVLDFELSDLSAVWDGTSQYEVELRLT
jgi:acetolactate decarboxylase